MYWGAANTSTGWSLIYCVLYSRCVTSCLEHPPNDEDPVDDGDLMMIMFVMMIIGRAERAHSRCDTQEQYLAIPGSDKNM